MEMFCESLREHAMKIINFKKKQMKSLSNKQLKSNQNAKSFYICTEKFEYKGTTVIIQGNIEMLYIAYVI